MASAAQQEGSAVADKAMEAGRDVAQEAASQASAVASEAKNQLETLVHEAKDEFRTQVDMRGQQAADGLKTLSQQLSALAEGRPQDAGRVGTMVGEAQQRLQSYSDRLQQRGPQALLDDVTAFARRRPGVFLMGAVATGFVVGRIVRAGAAANKEQRASNTAQRNGWDGSWQPASAQAIGTLSGPSDQTWPATGPTGGSTAQYGSATP
jgi:hypothetical protein